MWFDNTPRNAWFFWPYFKIAVISFDPDVGLFRGEFVGLNGGAGFYADSVDGLHKEGEASLQTLLEGC